MSPYGVASPVYLNREDAGRRLAEALAERESDPGIVFGLARGGVPVAAEIAGAFDAPLDAIAVRKIGHPDHPEYALGAVAAHGPVYFPELATVSPGARQYVQRLIDETEADAVSLHERLHVHAEPLDPHGRPCTLVDDGLATGATMIAACRWARERGASRVIAAMPVASRLGADEVRAEADAVVCPKEVAELWAVSVWYRDFRAAPEAEVRALLERSRAAAASTGEPAEGSA